MNPNPIDPRIDRARTVIIFGPRPPEAPAGWIVMNAPRPLDGTTTWQGDWNCGLHYAAIDPSDPHSGHMITDNLEACAVVVRYQDLSHAKPIVRHHYLHFRGITGHELNEIFKELTRESDENAATYAREITYGRTHADLVQHLQNALVIP